MNRSTNMTVSLSTFDRLKSKGVASFQDGDYLAAKTYLVDAAECIIGIAQETKSVEARRQHEELAAELIELVRECDRRAGSGMQGNPPRSPLGKGRRQSGRPLVRWEGGEVVPS